MANETKARNYILEVVDAENHTTFYLYSSTHKKGVLENKIDCFNAIEAKCGTLPKKYDGSAIYNEYSVYLDTAKNRDEQMVEESENSAIVDCR